MSLYFNSSLRVDYENEQDFINRHTELKLCMNAISNGEKIIIFGERGVGKTALLFQIKNQILLQSCDILPIYISFGGYCINHELDSCITFMLINLLGYIWKDILGLNLTALYDEEEKVFDSELEAQVKRIHKLVRLLTYEYNKSIKQSFEANFVLKGAADKTTEKSFGYSTLTNQELYGLFSELCEDLRKHCDIGSLVFLCDEANVLEEEVQIRIEKELKSLFSYLSCSFVYVESTSISPKHHRDHSMYFDQVFRLNGFSAVEYSKKLINNRIIDNDLISIDENVYKIVHNCANGNPRFLVSIMEKIISNKTSYGDIKKIHIDDNDAKKGCSEFEMEQERCKKMLEKIIN